MTTAMPDNDANGFLSHDAVPIEVETTIGQDWAGTPLEEHSRAA